MIFKKVTYVDNDEMDGVIARVEENTDELQLNKNIFDYLPEGFKEFVLYHEEGHIILKTSDEFQANMFAIHQYIPAHVATDELGRRIVVMTQALTPGSDAPFRHGIKTDKPAYKNYTAIAADPVSNVALALSSIVGDLGNLGIGSKRRINETKATAAGETQIIYAQGDAASQVAQVTGKNTNNMILFIGGSVVVIMAIYFMFR
jgi:hypothetical protein